MLAVIITGSLLGGWVLLWGTGVFDAVGPKVAGLVLGADVLTVGVVWAVFLRRDLSRRR
jgi:hypothetical protein